MNYDLNLDFISMDQIAGLTQTAEQKGELDQLAYTYKTSTKYIKETCPQCGSQGFFRVSIFGRMHHPSCNWSGYMESGNYFLYELKCSYNSGIEFVMIFHDQKKEGPGLLGILISLLWGLLVRLPIGIILVIINIILHLTKRRG